MEPQSIVKPSGEYIRLRARRGAKKFSAIAAWILLIPCLYFGRSYIVPVYTRFNAWMLGLMDQMQVSLAVDLREKLIAVIAVMIGMVLTWNILRGILFLIAWLFNRIFWRRLVKPAKYPKAEKKTAPPPAAHTKVNGMPVFEKRNSVPAEPKEENQGS